MQSLRYMKQQIHLGGARSTVVCIFRVFTKQLFIKYLLCGRSCSWIMGVTKADAFLSCRISHNQVPQTRFYPIGKIHFHVGSQR